MKYIENCKMSDVSSTISTITLNVNGLKTPIKSRNFQAK